MKRTLSFILALVLLIGLMPMNVFAAETAETTEATETTEVTEAIEVTEESEPTEYVDSTSPEAEVNIIVVDGEDNNDCIPEGWYALPISSTENSDHIAYKIENGVLTFHDFGDPSSGSYGKLPDYTNTTDPETKYDITYWYQNRSEITAVIFDDTISYIGAYTMTNMDAVTEIRITNPNASVAKHAVLFSTTNRATPLSIYAASTITTSDSWIRRRGAEPISGAISDVVLYFTDLAYLVPQFKAVEDALKAGTAIDADTLSQALVLLNKIPQHNYKTSDYRCALPETDNIVDVLRSMSSGVCGENLTYRLNAASEEGKLNLVISGTGGMTAYAEAAEAPWYGVADCISDVTISEGVTNIPNGVMPAKASYHVFLNSYAYSYAVSNNYKIQLDKLRVLCIGNSHTADYSQFLPNIITDLKNDGLQIEIVINKSITGSISMFSGRNSNANAANRSQLAAIQNGVGAYNNLVKNRYDLIIIQDYLESVVDEPAVFAAGISNFIQTIKTIAAENGNGEPQIAWFADWVDIRTTGAENALYDGNGNKITLPLLSRAEVYQKSRASISAVETAIAANTPNMPDFVIHASTIKQNAMSSYLGTTKMWDSSKYCLLERDTTHLTYELGRYLLGAGVMSEIITHYGDILALGRNGTNVGDALTVQNGPVASGSGCQYEGAINEDLLAIIREAISSPDDFRQSSYTADPVDGILAEIAGMTWNLDEITDEDSAMESITKQIMDSYGKKLSSVSVTIDDFTSVNQFEVSISIVYGYSTAQKTVKIYRAEKAMSMRYDDHLDMTGKAVEIIDAGNPTSYQVGYGVDENAVLDTAVVTLKGNTLVATGIGTAMVQIDGETYEITVTAAPISLLLLAGQSNMQGSEGDENQSIVCPDGMVYSTYGDRYTMTTSNATNFAPSALTGSGSDVNVNGNTTNLEEWPIYLLNERGVGKKGPDSGFAYEWVKQTGEKVWVINTAHGGSSINTWQKTGENYKEALALFTACQETLRKEIAAGHYTLSHMGYFWCQGCTDYGQTAEWYVNKYLTMHENFKTQMAFDHDSNSSTDAYVFEFGGIIPVRAGNESYISYRQGVYSDSTTKKYYESFTDLRFTGPRVAQYWMANNPDLPDIWNVCNIGEDWVWMPDGTNGVTEYFQSHYPNGTVDYTVQVQQSASWYTPTTPAAVHDSIHYNQIGYNEVGREAARNALIMLGEIESPDVETSVQFLSWDGYTEVTEINASTAGSSGTLVVPKVYPVWESKNVTYAVTDGMSYEYYDLLADSPLSGGKLYAIGFDNGVTVQGRELNSYSWELENGILVSTGETENTITRVTGTTENNVFLDTQYRLEEPFVLLHDQTWVLEWKMTGPWYDSDSTTSQKLFCQDGASATPGSMCLMIKGNENRITIGYYGTTTHISYGLDLDNYGISMTDTHVYRLANHINDDGSNAIYLFVDGTQIAPMTHYFTGTSGAMGEESDCLSGKDISFGYLGVPKYLLDNGVIEYISVVESGASSDIHFHDWSDWETVKAPDRNGPGEQNRTCHGCGEMETQIITSIWQTTNILKHWNELPDTVCSDLNLWAVLEHDPKYYVNSKGDWDYHSSKNVPSVTFAVNPGDQIYATSFSAAKVNGHGSSNGIRVTWFGIDGVIKTTDPSSTYAEFTKNGGYLIAPEGAIAVNIPMWNNSDSNEIYILNREHAYENGTCAGCGDHKGAIITHQPESVEQEIGKKFAITVKAEGEGLNYQWYVKEAGAKAFKVSSNKTSAYAYTMQHYMNGRQVYCVITDKYGNQVTTETATITRTALPVQITEQPFDVYAEMGETFSVKVKAEGEGLSYQWYYKNANGKSFAASSIKKSTYSSKMVSYMVGRQVYCVVTDKYGNQATSDVVTINLPAKTLEIVAQPVDAQAAIGERFRIFVEAEGEGLTYQWYYKNKGGKSFAASSNKTSAYAYTMQSYMNNRQVYCIITDQFGNQVTTDIATIHIQ